MEIIRITKDSKKTSSFFEYLLFPNEFLEFSSVHSTVCIIVAPNVNQISTKLWIECFRWCHTFNWVKLYQTLRIVFLEYIRQRSPTYSSCLIAWHRLDHYFWKVSSSEMNILLHYYFALWIRLFHVLQCKHLVFILLRLNSTIDNSFLQHFFRSQNASFGNATWIHLAFTE